MPQLPDIPGMDDLRRAVVPLGRAGPTTSTSPGKRFALVGAGASGFQIAPTIADDVEQLTDLPAHRAVDVPEPATTTRAVPDGDRWAMRHLPFYGRWFRFLMFYPGIAVGIEPLPHRPRLRRRRRALASTRRTPQRRELFAALDAVAARRPTPTCIEKSFPTTRRSGKRMLQDNGSWLRMPAASRTSSSCAPASSASSPDGVVTVDGTLRPADVICYATGFRHNDFLAPMDVDRPRRRRRSASSGATSRRRTSASPSPNFPNLFCLYGPGTNLAARREPVLPLRVPGPLRDGRASTQMLASGAGRIEVAPGGARRVRRALPERDRASWCGRTRRSSTATTRTRTGKIFTLSPWPLDLYWEWTRRLDPDDYVIA